MKKILIFLLLTSQFCSGQNLFARQNFAGGGVITYNTYIGGVSGTISTASALATVLGISAGRISNFTISGSDIKCKITGGTYTIPADIFYNSTNITYFNDNDNLVTDLGSRAFKFSATPGSKLRQLKFNGVVTLTGNQIDTDSSCEEISLENCTSIPNSAFVCDAGYNHANFYYIPKCTSLGSTSGNNSVFANAVLPGCRIYAHPSLATNNGGSPDGDLADAISQGASVRYVTNYTSPNPVTTLAAGTIYNTAIQLNFTAPTGSTNAIDYYECYANGVFKNRIAGSGGYITGLTQNANVAITVVSVDVFRNKSVSSNILNTTTANSSWDITNGLISYYKLDSNSNDSFGANNGTDTSVSYVSGKISNAGSYNGTTSKSVLGNPASLQLNSGSVSCWVKTTTPGSSDRFLFGKTLAYACYIRDGVITVYSWAGSSGSKTTGINIADGNWHHIAYVFDSGVTNGSKVYIDGVLKLTTSITVSAQTDPVTIGNTNYTQPINALIDEANIYSTKLTQSEVDVLWNGGAGTTL